MLFYWRAVHLNIYLLDTVKTANSGHKNIFKKNEQELLFGGREHVYPTHSKHSGCFSESYVLLPYFTLNNPICHFFFTVNKCDQ